MNGRDRSSNGVRRQANGRLRYSNWPGLFKLLLPGVGVKRWLILGAAGISVWSIGVAFLLRKLLALGFPDFLPGNSEGYLLLGAGLVGVALALYGLYRTAGPLILATSTFESIADTIYTRRSLGRGPRVVVIGGGTGLSVLLRGIKQYTGNLTAIVTVGDDGGSSGRLRRELGVLPPGDFRNCLVALSDDESLVSELFQYRFDQGDGLKGHSLGNLFIAALTEVTKSFETALSESSKVLAIRGRIVPATTANLSLSAELEDGRIVQGESSITEMGAQIRRIMIEPEDAQAHPLALEAIREAQLVIVGPGSLYTSILPNLLVSGLAEALRRSSATKVFVCNVATQQGETDSYTVADHLEALRGHTFPEIVSHVVANDAFPDTNNRNAHTPVTHDGRAMANVRLVLGDLVDPERPVRHDAAKLARLIMDVYHRGADRSRNRSKPAVAR